jgi:hypothetical protein
VHGTVEAKRRDANDGVAGTRAPGIVATPVDADAAITAHGVARLAGRAASQRRPGREFSMKKFIMS